MRAPSGLGRAGRRLWRSVLAEYELSAAELVLLEQAARTADLLEAMTAELAGGVTAEGSVGQVRAHPLLAAAAEHRKVLGTLLMQLALPLPGEEYGQVRSPQQHAAAQARWRAEYGRG